MAKVFTTVNDDKEREVISKTASSNNDCQQITRREREKRMVLRQERYSGDLQSKEGRRR